MRNTILLFVIFALVGCSGGSLDPSTQIDDAVVAERVRTALAADAALSAAGIDVSVDRGAVRLTGTVRSASDRERAAAIVQGVAGVKSVENLISAP
jgi:hyperosmotically inducible protein